MKGQGRALPERSINFIPQSNSSIIRQFLIH